MILEWLPEARRDRANQIDWVGAHNPAAAARMSARIDAVSSRLADLPLSGRAAGRSGARILVVTGTPYLLAYRVEAAAVVILRLFHSSQDWTTNIDR